MACLFASLSQILLPTVLCRALCFHVSPLFIVVDISLDPTDIDVAEDVGSFEYCLRVINPGIDNELPIEIPVNLEVVPRYTGMTNFSLKVNSCMHYL